VALSFKPEEQADADDTRELVEAEGRRCVLLPGDLRDHQYCEAIVAQTVRQLGKLNIVISNAAEQFVSTDVAELPNEQFEDTFQVNFFPLVRVVKAALPHLHAGDSIIATSSINAYRGNQQLVDYTSTKGAITAYIRSISQQLAEKKIRANTVAPGPIWTPLIPASFPPDKVEKFGQDTTLKRPGQPAEVAPAFVFLASEDASYITGQAIHPNGGEVLNT
jgi:NAD(P)-dependent dehydrogenase (short-subunit alcohol dehydrogenase family)